ARPKRAWTAPVATRVGPNTGGGRRVAPKGRKMVSPPAVGPLRGDGKPVVVVGSNEEYREAVNFSSTGNKSIGGFQALGLLDGAHGRLHALPAGGDDDPPGMGKPPRPPLPRAAARTGPAA